MTIVDEIRQDPQQGAKRLESEYRAGLTTLARRFCDDDGDAAELVNRTFAEVVASIDRYAEQSAFFGWMSRILVNLHTKDVRRKSNETVFSDDILPDVAPDPDAEARIFREVDASILRDAIDGLPADMKETLLLHYFMDLPVGKVGKILSIPDGTVKWRLHYAREILAAKLGAAAKKPGAKALLVVLALAALTAAGAAIAGARAARPQNRNADEPSALRQDAAQSRTGGTGGTEGTEEASDLDVFSGSPTASVPLVASVLSFESSFETDSSTTQTPTEEQTMNSKKLLAAQFAALSLAVPFTASAYDWTGFATLTSTWNNNNPHYSSFVSTSDWNWPGSVPATFDDAAAASARYGVPSGYSCFVNPGERASLPGSLIAIEGWLYSKFTDPYDVGTAHLLPGGGFRLNGANACFSGNVTVFGTEANPSRAYLTAATAGESTGFEFRNMTLSGDAGSAIRFFGNSSCKLGVFKWTGDGSGFFGTLQVDAKEMSASPAVSKLILGDMTVNGTVKICDRSYLTLAGTSGVTVSNAVFEAGSTLAGVSATRKLTVTGSLSANAPITIDMSSYTPSATAETIDLVSFPAGADISDLSVSAFTLANGTSARVTYGGTLFVRDIAGGGKALSLSVPSASEFVSRVKGVASTPDYPGYSEFDHTEDASGNAFWSDGNLPNSPGTDYFSDYVTLVPPVSSEFVGTFGGRSLTLRNASLQQGAVSVGFNVPDLRFSGNCGIRLWNSAGIWSTDFRDENGAQYRTFRLQGSLNTGYGSHWIELYNEKHLLCVESELSGSGDISLRTYPSMTMANCEAFLDLAALNTNWAGKIEVSGFGANYTDNDGYKDYSGISLPNREKRCRLFVSDGRNLGGARESFAYDALFLHHYGELFCRNNVSLDDGLNRGVSFGDYSTLCVTNGLTLSILRPTTWDGCVFKTGGGTLMLGGALSFGGASQSATPTDGKNVLAMEAGWLAPASAAAFDGLCVTFSNGAGISLVSRPDDATVAQYGLYDVKVATPFAVGGGGTIPVMIDFSREGTPLQEAVSIAVATVDDSCAEALREMLSFAPDVVPHAFNGEFRVRYNGDGTGTVLAKLSPAATVLFVR